MSELEVRDLDEALKDLAHWSRFGLYLPEIEQKHIDVIEGENRRVDDQRLALYKTWLRVYPSASWADVILALEKVDEKAIARKLRAKFLATVQTTEQPEKNPAVETVMAEVIASKNVIDELGKLNKSFSDLAINVISEFESNVENGKTTVEHLVMRTEIEHGFDIPALESVQTTKEYFRAIKPHYNFLNCYLIIPFLVSLLSPSSIVQSANKYSQKLERFMNGTEIGQLRNTLECYIPSYPSDTRVPVKIKLESAWQMQKIKLVEVLIQTLFGLQPHECRWFRVVPGSLLLTFFVSPHMMMQVIVISVTKLQFMRLVGVVSLQVGNILVLQEKEHDGFTFDNCLIQATVNDDIEVAQFLLKHIEKINVNVRIYKSLTANTESNELYMAESEITKTLLNFRTSFINLVKEMEFELRNALKRKLPLKQILSQVRFQLVKTSEEFFRVFRNHHAFLNCQLIFRLVHLLPDSITQTVNEYNSKLELCKKEMRVIYMREYLQLHGLPDFWSSVGVVLKFENAWRACSIWFVERLLQLVFSAIYLEAFQWVVVAPEPLTIGFIVPEHLMMSLIVHSARKIQFMKLVGVTSLRIGRVYMLDEKRSMQYDFEEAAVDAKSKEDNEAVEFLLQIEQQPLVSVQNYVSDGNRNYHIFPDCGSTVLMIACCNDNLRMVKLLLQSNADPNLQNDSKHTALMYSCRNSEIVQKLIYHNADINQLDIQQQTAMHWSCRVGNVQALEVLISRNALKLDKGTPHFRETHLPLTVQHARPKVHRNRFGETPLYLASEEGHLDVVENLLRLMDQDDLSIKANNGTTVLHIACTKGHLRTVEQLLKRCLNPNIQDRNGYTALLYASQEGHLLVVERLLAAGSNLNMQTADGTTPLYLAISRGHLPVAEKLLDAKADPNIQSCNGTTPLFGAIVRGHLCLVEKLLEAQADPTIPGDDGLTPIDVAKFLGYNQTAERLKQAVYRT